MSSGDQPANRGRWATTIAATYFFSLAVAFCWTYIPRYFATIGWTSSAIGLMLGIATLVRVCAMPAWARVAERLSSTTTVVRAVCTAGAGLLWLLPFVEATWSVYLVIAAIQGTWNAYLPLVDTLTVRQVGSSRFGRIRAFGSIGFGIAAAVIAFVAAGEPHATVAGWAPWIVASLATASAATTWAYPNDEVSAKSPTLAAALRLLNRPALLWSFPIWMVHWAAQAPYNLFLVFLAEQRGMPGWVPGAAVATGVVAEALVLGAGRRFVDRLGPERAIALCGLVTTLRWLGCATTTSATALVALQVTHGVTFGLFLLAAMAVLDREVPSEIRNSGQAAFYVLVFGAGSAIGNTAAGWLDETYGAASAFGVAAGADAVVTVVAAFYALLVVGRLVNKG